jgi:hypothetical protein
MSDIEYDLDDPRDVRRMLTAVERENLARILAAKIETDDDYAAIGKLVDEGPVETIIEYDEV